jgi:D-arabinose 1-dehydrogenase-like Zn-dependent alcohol dehydrogenase
VTKVSDYKVSDRVGMGWFHKFCEICDSCVTSNRDPVEALGMQAHQFYVY